MMQNAQPPLRSNDLLDRVPRVASNFEGTLVKVYGQQVGEANEILVAHSASCG
ncbi:MAG: hypothetical protein QOH41_1521 [Blastocatellia bacterium]|jgi:hypothetical protein|nr:hypothetical protein [Blastocatellia bacterium]